MSLPNGFYPVLHTFGIDNYRVLQNPVREAWSKYWWNDSPTDPNWNVFVEAVTMPVNQAPKNWRIMGGLLDIFPRTAWYGGPITRDWAQRYRTSFEQWAASQGLAYETAVIPIQPNATGMRYPKSDFAWYYAYEVRPPTRYRFMRRSGEPNFRWVDVGFDTWKYPNFHSLNPRVF